MRYEWRYVNGRKVWNNWSSVKGFTIIELLVVVAIIAIFVGLVMAVITKNSQPKVVGEQSVGTLEATGARTITKVHYSQIENFLIKIPANVKVVQVVALYSNSGNSFGHYYLVITEKP